MIKKLSKSRKKKTGSKLTNSRTKPLKQVYTYKEHKQMKQYKNSNKNNHQSSTLSLLSNHNHQASQCSLYDDHKSKRKVKNINRDSSVCSIVKDGKIKDRQKERQKQKQKDKDKDKDKQKQKQSKQIKKNKKLSSLNQNSKNKRSTSKLSPHRAQKNDKSTKALKQKQKQVGCKKNKKSRQQEIYERINLGLYNSKTNSQIHFSNNSSVRQNNISQFSSINNMSSNLTSVNQSRNKKFLTIDCSDQYILNQYFNNSRIKNHERKRTQAAIKIQKVFRGYLTRKMLQQYIKKQQERLNQISRKIIESRKQSGHYGSLPNSKDHSFISNTKNQKQQCIERLSKNKYSEDIFLEQITEQNKNIISKTMYEKGKQRIFNNVAKVGQQAQVQISLQLKNSIRQIHHPVIHDSLDEQSSIYAQPQQITNQSNLMNDQSQIFDQYVDFHAPSYQLRANRRLKGDEKQVSQQFLKYTPSSSLAPISKSKFEQPIPTDFSQKRVSQLEPQISNKSRDLSVGNNRKMYKNVNEFNNNSPEITSEQRENQVINLPKKIEQKNLKDNLNINGTVKEIGSINASGQDKNKITNNKNITKINEKSEKSNQEKQKKLISILKKDEKQKWQKVIKMLSHQIEQAKEKSLDSEKFMNVILEFSKKNKEQLQKSNIMSFQKTISFEVQQKQSQQFCQSLDFLKDSMERQKEQVSKQERSVQIEESEKSGKDYYYIRKRKNIELDSCKQQLQKSIPSHEKQFEKLEYELKIAKQQIKITQQKNLDLPLLNKKYQHANLNMLKANYSSQSIKQNTLFDKTEKLKDFYRKNCQLYPIEQMIKVREKALEKRQKQQLNRLNEDLFHEKLKHDQFLRRLSEMQQKFQQQRRHIQRAKMEIFIGYRATHKLIQDSVKDAWYLGFKIPLTQSLKDFKKMHSNSIWIKEIIVDQLKFYSTINQNSNKMATSQLINLQNSDNLYRNENISDNSLYEKNYIHEGSFENEPHQQFKDYNSIEKLSNDGSAQKRRQEASLSINEEEDSSLTIKQNNESQQSFCQEISYNQGQVEVNNLTQDYRQNFHPQQEEISSEQSDEYDSKELKGFKKIDHSRLTEKVPIKLTLGKKNCLQDIDLAPNPTTFSNRNKIVRKISVNNKNAIKYPQIKQIRKYQMTPRNNKQPIKPKSQIYCLDLQSSSDQEEYQENQEALQEEEQFDQDIKDLTEELLFSVIWEAIGQIYNFYSFKMKSIKFGNKQPSIIHDSERSKFIKILIQHMPKFQSLKPRINQKMMASRIEVLKFMRVCFDDESLQKQMSDFMQESLSRSGSSESYEQIGKYQHILPAITCINALDAFLQEQQKEISPNQQAVQHLELMQKHLKQQYKQKISYQTLKKVIQRQKVMLFNKKQRQDLRRQIKKVQFHCIFDSLNQIIMKKRLKITGYSGIGLNQLSLITRTEIFRQIHHEKQFVAILSESVKQVEDLISSAKTSGQKLLMENYQKLCQNDSQWIYYTDEALSFALQFVYMLEDEIFYEQTAQIFKRNFKL